MVGAHEHSQFPLETDELQRAQQELFQDRVGETEVARLLEVELLAHGLVYYGHPQHRPWSRGVRSFQEGTKDYRIELSVVGETIQFLCQTLKKLLPVAPPRDSFADYLDALLCRSELLHERLLKQGRFHSASASLAVLHEGMQGFLPMVEAALSAKRVSERVFYGIHQLLVREVVGSGVFSLRSWRQENGILDLSPSGHEVLEQAREVSLGESCVLPVSELCECSTELIWLAQQSRRGMVPGFVLAGFSAVHARLFHLEEILASSFSMQTESMRLMFESVEQELIGRVYRLFVSSAAMLRREISDLMRTELGRLFGEDEQLSSSPDVRDAYSLVIRTSDGAQRILYEVLEFWCRTLRSQFGVSDLGASELRCGTFIERYEQDLALLSYLVGAFLDRLNVYGKEANDLRNLSRYREVDDFRRLFRKLHYVSLSALPQETHRINRSLHDVLRGVGHSEISLGRLRDECTASYQLLRSLRQQFPPGKTTGGRSNGKQKLRADVGWLISQL